MTGTLSHLTWSRTALPYSLAVALSMLALWAWVRGRRRPGACALGMAAAAAATLAKISFVFTLAVAAALWFSDALAAWRRAERGVAMRLASVVAGTSAACAAVVLWIRHASFLDWTQYEDEAVWSRLWASRDGWTDLPVRELLAFTHQLSANTGAAVLVVAMGLLLVAAQWRRGLRLPPLAGTSRAGRALVLWAVAGLALVGLSRYQPGRFHYFALPPLAYAVAAMIRTVAGDRRWVAATAIVVLLHLTSQVGPTVRWLARSPAASAVAMGRDMAQRIAPRQGEVLLGRLSSFVSLFDSRIRPLDVGFVDPRRYGLCDRLRRWRPRFFTYAAGRPHDVAAECPRLVARVVPIARYRLMGNYYHGPQVLARLEYR